MRGRESSKGGTRVSKLLQNNWAEEYRTGEYAAKKELSLVWNSRVPHKVGIHLKKLNLHDNI